MKTLNFTLKLLILNFGLLTDFAGEFANQFIIKNINSAVVVLGSFMIGLSFRKFKNNIYQKKSNNNKKKSYLNGKKRLINRIWVHLSNSFSNETVINKLIVPKKKFSVKIKKSKEIFGGAKAGRIKMAPYQPAAKLAKTLANAFNQAFLSFFSIFQRLSILKNIVNYLTEEKQNVKVNLTNNYLMKTLNFTLKLLILNFGLLTITARLAFAGELANQFTIELWVKPQSSAASKALMVKNNEIRLVTNASSQPLCQIYSGGAWQTAATSSTALSLNNWNYVGCTYDKSNLKIFINGVQTGSQALSVSVNDAATNFRVGSDEGGSYGDLNGSVDELRIYNYARTEKQIIEDMNAGHPAGGSPVGSQIEYWKFDGNLNSSLTNGSTATIFDNGTASYTNNGKFNKALDFTTLESGNFTWVNNNTLRDSSKNWTTNQWAGYQFSLSWNGAQYCEDTINSNTATDITFSMTCNSFSGSYSYVIKKALYAIGPMPGQPTDKITTSLWFKSNGSQDARIVRAQNDAVGLSIGTNYVGGFVITYTNQITYSTNPHDNKWHYLAITWDGTTQKLYYDGVLRNSSSLTGSMSSSNKYLNIGTRSDGFAEHFNGQIDEIKIYNYALTEDEIKLDYNRGAAMVLGSTSTDSSGNPGDNSSAREYCIPGDTSYCAPPVAEWKFDEKTGSYAYDTSGNGNTGTLTNGPTWVNGKIGGALRFTDSENKYVDAGNGSSVLNITGPITVEAWVKTYSLPPGGGSWDSFLTKGTSSSIWMLGIDTWGGASTGYVFTLNGTNNYVRAANEAYNNNGKWTHLVGVYDGNYLKIYVNAQFKNQTSYSSGITSSTESIRIGKAPNWSEPNADVDHVRIYNYARTPAQIAWDYNRGQPVGWWKFDECQGTTAYDSSGNGNNGTITIGAAGAQTSAGTCSTSGTAWGNGASGKYNSSLNFDGSDDYVSIVDNPLLQPKTSDWSVSVWAKLPNSNQLTHLVSKRQNISPYEQYTLGTSDGTSSYGPGKKLYFSFLGDLSSKRRSKATIEDVIDGNWHLYTAVVIRGSDIKLYVDGLEKTSSWFHELTWPDIIDNADPLRIANDNSTTYTAGQIDDVRIYNYALTPLQVKQIYNEGASVRFGPNSGTP